MIQGTGEMGKNIMIRILIVANVILYLTMVGLWIALPDHLTLNIATSMGTFVLTCLLLFPNREHIYKLAVSRFSKKIRENVLSLFLIIGILGFINYLVFKNNIYRDLTRSAKYTLSDQSIKTLRILDKPLKMKVFVGVKERGVIAALLNLYKFHKRDFEVEFIDPALKPNIVEQYHIAKYGSIIIEYDGRNALVKQNDELGIMNAILKAFRADKTVVYYTIGHREIDFDLTSRDGGSFLKQMLQDMAYELKAIDLTKVKEMPADSDALLILGPTEGFLQRELKIMKEYVDNQGKLLIAISPEIKAKNRSVKLGDLRKTLESWDIQIHNDVIVDRLSSMHGADPSVLFIDKYESKHSIVKGFSGRTVFPLTSSISEIKRKQPRFRMDSIVQSANFPACWAESDMDSVIKGNVVFSDLDFKGPVSLMTTSEEIRAGSASKRTRIVAFGNASFIVNGYRSQGANFNLFLNAFSWLVDEESLISLNRPEIRSEPVFMSGIQLGVIFYFSVVFVPLILLVLGIYIYRRRKRL